MLDLHLSYVLYLPICLIFGFCLSRTRGFLGAKIKGPNTRHRGLQLYQSPLLENDLLVTQEQK